MKNKVLHLLDRTITINFVDNVTNEEGRWLFGITEQTASGFTIEVSTKSKEGKPLAKDAVMATLKHELFHCILDTMMYFQESSNESLVEWLAQASMILSKQGVKI